MKPKPHPLPQGPPKPRLITGKEPNTKQARPNKQGAGLFLKTLAAIAYGIIAGLLISALYNIS